MKRPNMVGRTNHFKHNPGMGLAVLLLSVGMLVAVPLGLLLIVLCIQIPYLIFPIAGVIYYPFWKQDRETKKAIQEHREIIGKWERDMEQFRKDMILHEREFEEKEIAHRLRIAEDNREFERLREKEKIIHEKVMARIRSRRHKSQSAKKS